MGRKPLKPRLIKLDLKDQQFKLLFAVEKILFGVGLLVGINYLVKFFPELDKQLNPVIEMLGSGVISHFIVDLYGKRKFDKMVDTNSVDEPDIPDNSTSTDDSQTDSTD